MFLYFVTMSIMLFSVLIFPALAIRPSLLAKPLTAAGIPIISALITGLCAFLLIKTHLYTQIFVDNLSIAFAVIAGLRLFFYYRKHSFLWSKRDRWILVINVMIVLPLIGFAAGSSMGRHDEIYSWNYWALQHYASMLPDFQFTGAPYPQLWPLLISYCYKIFGNTALQASAKGICFIFSLVLLQTLAHLSRLTPRYLLLFLLLAWVSLLPNTYYTVAYADTKMVASLIFSAACYYFYARTQNKEMLWLCICGAVAASLFKQPGMLWAIVALPLLLLHTLYQQKRWSWSCFGAIIISILPSTIWFFTSGHGVLDNHGVIHASLAQRNLSAQIIYEFKLIFFHLDTAFFPLLILTILTVYKNKNMRPLFYVMVLPSFLLWYFFAGYELRTGLHILALCGLIIAGSGYLRPYHSPLLQKIKRFVLIKPHFLPKIGLAFIIIFGLLTLTRFILSEHRYYYELPPLAPQKTKVYYKTYPMNGPKTVISSFFGPATDLVYSIAFHPNIKIMATSNYDYGFLYFNNKALSLESFTSTAELLTALKNSKPNYVFVSRSLRLPEDLIINKVAVLCPQFLEKIVSSNQSFGYQVFKINNLNALQTCMDTQQ